jgi:hypothetical protein
MFECVGLVGQNRSELNTEMRFLFASAKVDGVELLKLDLPHTELDKENARINSCVIKILRSMKKEGIIEFYVNREGFSVNSTEAIFLQNKYSNCIETNVTETASIYVKM